MASTMVYEFQGWGLIKQDHIIVAQQHYQENFHIIFFLNTTMSLIITQFCNDRNIESNQVEEQQCNVNTKNNT